MADASQQPSSVGFAYPAYDAPIGISSIQRRPQGRTQNPSKRPRTISFVPSPASSRIESLLEEEEEEEEEFFARPQRSSALRRRATGRPPAAFEQNVLPSEPESEFFVLFPSGGEVVVEEGREPPLGTQEQIPSTSLPVEQRGAVENLEEALSARSVHPIVRRSYVTEQTYPVLRLEWLEDAAARLEGLTAPGCDLAGILSFDGSAPLGEGAYGYIYRATFPDDPTGYPVALKVFKEILQEREASTEAKAFSLTNGLLRRGQSPNFTLLFRDCNRLVAEVQEYVPVPSLVPLVSPVEVLEFADGDLLETVAAASLSERQLISIVVQTLSAIAAMARMDLSHNDLYLRNLLYSRIEEPILFEYRICGRSLFVDPMGYLVKVTDFGMATSPHIDRPHSTDMGVALPFQPGVNVYDLSMPPLGRDLYAFLSDLAAVALDAYPFGSLSDAFVEWLVTVTKSVQHSIEGRGYRAPPVDAGSLLVILCDILYDSGLTDLLGTPAQGDRVVRFDVDSIGRR